MSQKCVRMRAIINLLTFPLHFHKVHHGPATYVPGTSLSWFMVYIMSYLYVIRLIRILISDLTWKLHEISNHICVLRYFLGGAEKKNENLFAKNTVGCN